jgi:four helix bundle protein
MTQNSEVKKYDLQNRTYEFAKRVRAFVRNLPKTISNIEDARQLIRSSGSRGANYIEANDALSKKDFIHRLKICRKEAKESSYWLRLIYCSDRTEIITEKDFLIKEVTELQKIFGVIITKSS